MYKTISAGGMCMNNTVSRALGFISRHRRAASGAALVLAVLGPWLRASDGVILGVGGSVAYGAREAALALWGLGVKAFSNLLVIVLNYLFSKLLIFQKNNGAAPLDGNSKKRR